jgi:4-hydroxy-4-methyl-2-oxoglutarate aldolase
MTRAQLAAALEELSCTDLSDALDRFGIAGQCSGIMPLDRTFEIVGDAWTVRYGPMGMDGGTVGDYIDDVQPGQVVVLDNGGRCDVTVWGDLLTSIAHRRGVAGVVIDGVSRDLDRAIQIAFPIFSKGTWMRTGKDRVRVEALQEPANLGGVRVLPGDWIRGDGDGVVVVPMAHVEDVIIAAREIRDAEDRIRSAIDAGTPLRQARAQHKYHSLQTRRGR